MQHIIIGLLTTNLLFTFLTFTVVKQIQEDTFNNKCELKKINENSVHHNNILNKLLNKN